MRYPLNARTRQRAHQAIDAAPDGFFFAPPVEPTRTLGQSAKLHAMLADVARQVEWPVNGKMERLSIDDWKAVIVASLMQEKRMAAGLRGGFVILGKRTSSMSIREMSDAIEFLYSFGAEHGVQWSERFDVPGYVKDAAHV